MNQAITSPEKEIELLESLLLDETWLKNLTEKQQKRIRAIIAFVLNKFSMWDARERDW